MGSVPDSTACLITRNQVNTEGKHHKHNTTRSKRKTKDSIVTLNKIETLKQVHSPLRAFERRVTHRNMNKWNDLSRTNSTIIHRLPGPQLPQQNMHASLPADTTSDTIRFSPGWFYSSLLREKRTQGRRRQPAPHRREPASTAANGTNWPEPSAPVPNAEDRQPPKPGHFSRPKTITVPPTNCISLTRFR